jgi:hypothetical protein
MVAGRSLAWLVNAVVISTLFVFFNCSIFDLGSIAAQWNVRHSREVGGTGQPLDMGYLRQLGPAALVALATLEARPMPPAFRERVSSIRRNIQNSMEEAQRRDFGWTWRTARRLAAARSVLAGAQSVAISKGDRAWNGRPIVSSPNRPNRHEP